jgi:hypothetical protein
MNEFEFEWSVQEIESEIEGATLEMGLEEKRRNDDEHREQEGRVTRYSSVCWNESKSGSE